uniref:Uncharacterized protein n=1 Tax=Avena sativa TaxID=4498 RepID=A0ACD5ZNX6_AVESA
MEAHQGPRFGVEQKSRLEQTDEMLGSEVNKKFAEMCLNTAVEADIIPEKQYDPEARLEVDDKFVEMCLYTALETEINQEKQADPEVGSEVNEKPETCQDTAMEADANPEEKAPHPGVIYRCKKCRRMVATQEYVVTHDVGQGERCFLRRKTYHVDEKEPECACIFVEPMKWMQAVEEGYVSNKLWCMGCKTRLGSFNWAGMQCTCGAWVIPAFQLLKSRIDESQM